MGRAWNAESILVLYHFGSSRQQQYNWSQDCLALGTVPHTLHNWTWLARSNHECANLCWATTSRLIPFHPIHLSYSMQCSLIGVAISLSISILFWEREYIYYDYIQPEVELSKRPKRQPWSFVCIEKYLTINRFLLAWAQRRSNTVPRNTALTGDNSLGLIYGEGAVPLHDLTPHVYDLEHSTSSNLGRQVRRREKLCRLRGGIAMKFSSSIKFNSVPDWASHYIAYSNLKKLWVWLSVPKQHL